ncbi:MAG TPA: hypothetical protein VFU21_33505 [Kofleriaceae bacterium]|nr:hypothetical protein [Kofleriaceae bacterium]
MAKRSPILGYNHNVRHRGLIFHVQTEDSGIQSPHLFTHLFHGGVIISSRKLVYDNGSAEEVVKALMQSQHKAVLKDLKAGTFDDKIDRYLGGTPGLEPAPARRPVRDTDISPPPPELPAQAIGGLDDDQITPPAGSSLSEAVLKRAVPPDTDPPRLGPTPRAGPTIPPQPSKTGRSEVSGAFQAIVTPEEAVPSAVDDESSDTTLPRRREQAAPEPRKSKLTPSGAYSQHRAGRSDFIPEVHDQPTAPVPAKRARAASGEAERPPATRPADRPVPPVRPPVKPAAPSGASAPARGKGMPAQGASGAANAPQQPRPAVVVSRPAVIIGGPPKVVGARETQERVVAGGRRAREEPSRPNLFGKDLISEKSLDEVILAYLSEDSSEE